MVRAVIVPTWMAAILFALMLAMSSQALAQEATDPLQDLSADIVEGPDNDSRVDRITITVADCQVDADATIAVEDIENTEQVFTNEDNGTDVAATITAEQDTVLVDDIDEEAVDEEFGTGRDDTSEQGTVTSSTGIQCGTGGDADDDRNEGDGVQTAEDLLNASCENLLELFRSGTGQYGDAALFADPGVRDRVEECLKEEVVVDTAAKGNLPDTGGVSLFGLVVLGAVSAVAVLVVIRPGRTEG